MVVFALGLGYMLGSHLAMIAAAVFLAGEVKFRLSTGRELTLQPGAVFVLLVMANRPEALVVALFLSLLAGILFSHFSGDDLPGWAELLARASSLLLVVLWVAADSILVAITFRDQGSLGYVGALIIVAIGGLWILGDAALRAWARKQGDMSFRGRFGICLGAAPVAVVLLSASMAFALIWNRSPTWALAISVGPFAVTYRLLTSVARAEHIERLTIRALGRLPEAAGLSPLNHSNDVVTLAVGIGVCQGLSNRELRGLRRAASLHDIGLLCIKPQDEVDQGYSEADKGRWGAEIIGSGRTLVLEAELVRQSGNLHRVPGSDADSEADPRSQIIRVACAFHGLTASGVSTNDAVEVLYSEGFLHAPWAVESIRSAVALSSSIERGRM